LEVNNILQEWLFQERTDAAKHLARRLERLKRQEVQKEEDKEDEYNKSVIILAIPGGGVVIGDIIASELVSNLM
jgi:predicted phosphoribosyltransferase